MSPLDPRVQAARPAPGQQAIAMRLTSLLDGSALWQPGAARRVQDPVSLRCVSQVHGAALAALLTARDDVELELNSAADSPLVLADEGEMLSNGNFHVPALAHRVRHARHRTRACALCCACMRCQKLYSPALSGLPLQLTTTRSGALGLRDAAEDADRAVERHSPPRESGVARQPCPCRRPSRTTRRWPPRRREGRRDGAGHLTPARRDRTARRPRRRSTCADVRRRDARRAARATRYATIRRRSRDTRRRSAARSRRRDHRRGDRRGAIPTADLLVFRARDEVARQQLGPGARRALAAHRDLVHGARDRVRACRSPIGIWAARSERVFRWSIADQRLPVHDSRRSPSSRC